MCMDSIVKFQSAACKRDVLELVAHIYVHEREGGESEIYIFSGSGVL